MLNINDLIHDAMETCEFDFESEIETAVDRAVNELVQTIPNVRWRNAIEEAVNSKLRDLDNKVQDAIDEYVQEAVDEYID